MSRLVQSNVLMCHDGTIEGFLTLVFKAYAMHVIPQSIAETTCVQPAFGQEVVEVPTDFSLAERVKVGLSNHAGFQTYRLVEKAFRSCVEGRERDIFDYIVMAISHGRKAVADLSNPIVFNVERLARRTDNEAERMRQFVRFSLLENGVYYARINPHADVLPMIAKFFLDRYNTQPFLIYDEVHNMALVYDMRRHFFVKTDELSLPDNHVSEEAYQQMWKCFYDSINNEQRFNPDLRRSHMPQRFWKNLTEMQLSVKSEAACAAS